MNFLRDTVYGSLPRVAPGTANADRAARDGLLRDVEPIFQGLREINASKYAQDVSLTTSVLVLLAAAVLYFPRGGSDPRAGGIARRKP